MPIGVVIGLATGTLACLGTEIYLHRCLAHRAFSVHPALGAVLGGLMQVFGGVHPDRWVGVHRLHHRHADTPLDPHSPLERHPLLILLGTPYLFSAARHRLPAGSAPSPGVPYIAIQILVFAGLFLTIGVVQTIVALGVHLALYLGVMGAVNTFGHRTGRRPHAGIPGYDSPVLALFLLGHGYHNSHHAHPTAPRMGRLDPMWPIVRLLAGLGLVTFGPQRAPSRTCCTAAAPVTQVAPVVEAAGAS